MGNIIRKDAPPAAIFADARTTLTNAKLKGGNIKTICETQLLPVIAICDATEAEHKSAEATLSPLSAAVVIENGKADDFLGRTYDETWNDVGRPQYDSALSLLFPGGSSYYAEGDTEEQPLRMELLARLFERAMHPKLSAPQSQAKAAAVRAAALPLAQAVEAARVPAATVKLLEKVMGAVGKTAHAALVNTKRMLKVAGLSETEIHEIIPDRPASPPKKKGEGTGEK